jgi:two-component system, sensor histidine kinase and response regulator
MSERLAVHETASKNFKPRPLQSGWPCAPVSTPGPFYNGSGREAVVLVVDDNEKNRKHVGSILSSQNYEVLFAKGGHAALDQIAARVPDLVLLDLVMPGMDGLEVCKRLKANPQTMEVPIIFLTAAQDTEVAVTALEQGAVDFINKPFQGAELLARVRTHVELKRTRDELRRIITEKNELMSAVAHDLKNPLSAARFSALMLREPLSPSVQQELVKGMVEACDGMLAFIQDRLERNARESHGGELKIRPVNLADALATIVQKNLPIANAKQSSIDLVAGDGDPPAVLADYHGLCQVLDNLVSNALKFSPPGSCVKIAAEKAASDPTRVLVSVSDEGPGVSAEDQAHLFEPYMRLSAKPTAGESSTGLGLSIARRLVEQMRGEIGCDDRPGGGARFWIRIPVA